MVIFILGLLVFFAVHSIAIVAPQWRDAQVRRIGDNAWKGLYSLLSIASLVAFVYGYGIARHFPIVLYSPPFAFRHLTFLLMLPVFPLLIAAYLPGRVKRVTRHPMLLAVILWAISHLLANGTLNDLLLFGAFLVWAVADLLSVSLRQHVRPVPSAPASAINDAIVVVAGLGLYVFFILWAHVRLTGVSPLG